MAVTFEQDSRFRREFLGDFVDKNPQTPKMSPDFAAGLFQAGIGMQIHKKRGEKPNPKNNGYDKKG